MAPDEYAINTWVTFYEVKSSMTGCLTFIFSITNCTPMIGGEEKEITVEVKVVDRDDKLIHYLLTPNILKANGMAWDAAQKMVLYPGDKLLFKASANGLNLYASLVEGLMLF
jgi:hypothetical protein